jgi:uncharacterized NAD-dependent epimerase/dehydratase family protein
MVVMTEGQLGLFSAKTAAAVIRYRRDDVVAVLDSQHRGQKVEQFLPWGHGIPIVGAIGEALALQPDALLIGIAPMGGQLPDRMRRHVVEAIEARLEIVSGLHVMLAADAQIGGLARQRGVRIWDVRDTGDFATVATGRAAELKVKRVLAVGTDCVVGKKVAALELTDAARKVGLDAAFVPTGQTGIMIAGWGLAVDRVISDFVAGAAEWLVQQVADRQVCFIEGQGSIEHPGYSAVALGLLHGCCPQAMLMCHRPGRESHHGIEAPIAPLAEQIAVSERLARFLHPCRVVGLCINTAGMDDAAARRAIEQCAQETQLPAVDVLRNGCGPLIEVLTAELGLRASRTTGT